MTTTAPSPRLTSRALTAQASIAFVLAAIINSAVHEGAHAAAALGFGARPTLGPFSVDYDESALDPGAQIVIALAGPVFSLVMGLVVMVIGRNWGRGFGRLFWMWLPFMGVMNFVGYCVIAPVAQVGDTGKALNLLGAPGWVFVVVCLVGVAGQFLLARRFAVEVKRYAIGQAEERQLSFFSWLIGTPVVIVLTVAELVLMHAAPAHFVVVAAYAVAVGVFAPMQFIFSGRVHNTHEPLALTGAPTTGLIVTALAAAVALVVSGLGGIPLG